MKVLQLCHKPPKPSIDGGCIAMNNILCSIWYKKNIILQNCCNITHCKLHHLEMIQFSELGTLQNAFFVENLIYI